MKNLLATLWSYVSFALILIGIGGLAWHTFSEDGWAERFAGIVWEAETRNPLLMTPIIGGALFLISVFLRGGLKPSKSDVPGNALSFLMSLVGAYFTFVWIRGSL